MNPWFHLELIDCSCTDPSAACLVLFYADMTRNTAFERFNEMVLQQWQRDHPEASRFVDPRIEEICESWNERNDLEHGEWNAESSGQYAGEVGVWRGRIPAVQFGMASGDTADLIDWYGADDMQV